MTEILPFIRKIPDFSVLMAVYHRDNPEHFMAAMQSVTVDQRLAPTEVVLMVDGPVGDELNAAIGQWELQPSLNVRVIRSAKNIGLSRVLNIGLQECRYEYIARMDSDDVSEPQRFDQQLAFLTANPEIALLGSWYMQYDKQLRNVITDRKVPTEPIDVAKYSRRRTPFNHVTAVFKRSVILSVGGYPEIDSYLEDWWIALRLMKHGHLIANLPEYHVRVRGDSDFVARRGGLKYLRSEIQNLVAMQREKLMSRSDVTTNLMIRSTVRLVPNWARSEIYKAIRRAA